MMMRMEDEDDLYINDPCACRSISHLLADDGSDPYSHHGHQR